MTSWCRFPRVEDHAGHRQERRLKRIACSPALGLAEPPDGRDHDPLRIRSGRRVIALISLAALAAMFGGCGDGNSSRIVSPSLARSSLIALRLSCQRRLRPHRATWEQQGEHGA